MNVSLQFFEQVYTSAPRLLLEERGDLGIVAQTRGFPEDIAKELNSVRSYRLLDGIPTSEPGKHPPRYLACVRGKTGEYYCLSRVIFAGADHTGRTTPLAHHAVFRLQDLRDRDVSPAQLFPLIHSHLSNEWKSEPKWIDSPRSLVLPSEKHESKFPGVIWDFLGIEFTSRLLGQVATLMTERDETRRVLVLVLRPSQSVFVHSFISDLLTVLPFSCQSLGVQTHVFDRSEVDQQSAIVFTYPDTPFLDTTLVRKDGRRPFVFDLTTKSLPEFNSLDYGQWVESVIANGSNVHAKLVAGRILREKLGAAKNSKAGIFKPAVRLERYLHLASQELPIADMAEDVQGLYEASTDHTWLDNWIESFVKRVGGFQDAKCKLMALLQIGDDAKWRKGRVQALNILKADLIGSVTTLIAVGHEVPAARKFCMTQINVHSELAPQIIARAASGDRVSQMATRRVLADISSSANVESPENWLIAAFHDKSTAGAVRELQPWLLTFLESQIKRNPTQKDRFRQALCKLLGYDPRFSGSVAWLLLESCASDDEFRRQFHWIEEQLAGASGDSFFANYDWNQHSEKTRGWFERVNDVDDVELLVPEPATPKLLWQLSQGQSISSSDPDKCGDLSQRHNQRQTASARKPRNTVIDIGNRYLHYAVYSLSGVLFIFGLVLIVNHYFLILASLRLPRVLLIAMSGVPVICVVAERRLSFLVKSVRWQPALFAARIAFLMLLAGTTAVVILRLSGLN